MGPLQKFDYFKQRKSEKCTICEVVIVIMTHHIIFSLLFPFNKFSELYRHVAIIDNVNALVRC